jgi:outer membrane protein OmpA-like peptidoglycan-associated protein
MQKSISVIGALLTVLGLTSCSYNPFISNNHTTGSPVGAIAGVAIGAGGAAALGAPKPVIALAGIGGGMVGYYVTTLRYDSGGIMQAGGKVYQVGDYVGIYIPSDQLFESNSADFLPQAAPILDSVVAVLERYPDNNIMISGNTSGFARPRWEQRLSERRAQKVSAYLWNAGINQFKEPGNDLRKLNYVGYGDYFRIAQDDTNDGIRENSRVQITSYPSSRDLRRFKGEVDNQNVGSMRDSTVPANLCEGKGC